MTQVTENFAEITKSIEKGILAPLQYIINTRNLQKNQKDTIVHAINNSKVEFSSDKLKEKLSNVFTHKRKTLNDLTSFLNQLNIKNNQYDYSDVTFGNIKNMAEYAKKDLERIYNAAKIHSALTKSIQIDQNEWKIVTKSCFEIYCLMTVEFYSNEIKPDYLRLKDSWDRATIQFEEIFQPITKWGDIKQSPIFLDLSNKDNPILVKNKIIFKNEWYNKNSLELNIINAVEDKLGDVFNYLISYDQRYLKTHLGEGAPYKSEKFKQPQNLLNNFLNMAKGNKCYFSSDKCILTSKGNDSYELINFQNLDRKNENLIKTSGKKRKLDDVDSNFEMATATQAYQALSNLDKMINITSKTTASFITNLSKIFSVFENKGQQLFNISEPPPEKVYAYDLRSLRYRLNTIISNYENNPELQQMKDYIYNQEKLLLNSYDKNKKNCLPYFNSINNPELTKIWNEVMHYANKFVSSNQFIRVFKINNFNPERNAVEEPVLNPFLIDENQNILRFNVNTNDKVDFFQKRYKNEINYLMNELNELEELNNKYLDPINIALKTSIQFSNWFSGPPVMDLKSKLDPIKNLTNHTPLNLTGLKNIIQFLNSDKNIDFSIENIENFNKAILVFYSLPKYNVYENFEKNNNPGLKTKGDKISGGKIYSKMGYPSCFNEQCEYNIDSLYHLPIINSNNLKKIEFNLKIDCDLTNDFNAFNLILIQSLKNNLYWNSEKKIFDTNLINSKINEIKSKLEMFNNMSNIEYEFKYTVLAQTFDSMSNIMAMSNIDKSLQYSSNLILVSGPSGSGKTYTINGDGGENQGIIDTLIGNFRNLKIQMGNFEKYNLNFPFLESFHDSINEKLTKPKLFRFNITENGTDVSSVETETLEINNNVSIDTYRKNYSSKNGIRDNIDLIRENGYNRNMTTIRETKNNPKSSRSDYVQIIKQEDPNTKNCSYSVFIDRPGEEEPYSTFDIENELSLDLVNPIIGLMRKFCYLENWNETVDYKIFFYFFFPTPIKAKTFLDYFTQLVNIAETNLTMEAPSKVPNIGIGNLKDYWDPDLENFVKKYFVWCLERFSIQQKEKFSRINKSRFRERLENKIVNPTYRKIIIDYIDKIHHNENFLNFKIKNNKFEDYKNEELNLLINGFSKKEILIKDLFPMKEYATLLEKKTPNFYNLFFEDSFFTQINFPCLGWIQPKKVPFYPEKPNVDIKEFLVSQPTSTYFQNVDDKNYVVSDLTAKNVFLDKEHEFKVSLEGYLRFSKFGYQSYLNTHDGLTNFLMAIAIFFSIFYNEKLRICYDEKIKILYSIMGIEFSDKIRGFFEAISINETNICQNYLNNKKILLQNITFSDILVDAMIYHNDLRIPDFKILKKLNREYTFVNYPIFNFSYNNLEPSFSTHMEFSFNQSNDQRGKNEEKYRNFVESRKYVMGKAFNENLDWMTVSTSDFEKNSRLLLKTEKVLQVVVWNPHVTQTQSGMESYLSIVNNL